jgi:nucleotide-binding universal stress UspA family protein
VPLDFSETSFRALEFAVPLAARFDAAVHVLYVYEDKSRLSIVDRPELFSDPEIELFSDDEIARRLKGEVQRRFSTDLALEHCHYRTGRACPEICNAARKFNADLVVIASHGRTGLKHLTLGSTAEKVRHAGCPVLVVREATRGPIKTAAEGIVLEKILVPVDFSECAKEGARYASVFATKVGADLRLIHVVQPPEYTAAEGGIIGPPWPPLLQTTLIEAEDKLDEMVNFLPLVGISAETEVAVGDPIEKLQEASARAEVDMMSPRRPATLACGMHCWEAWPSKLCAWRNVPCWLCPVIAGPSKIGGGRVSLFPLRTRNPNLLRHDNTTATLRWDNFGAGRTR